MKTAHTWSFRPIVGRVMMGLVAAAMIASVGVAPAFARGGHEREEQHDNGRYEHRGRGYDHRDRHVRVRRVYRPDRYYRERVYVAPRVIYEPPPPPGISIFFPPLFINP